MQLSSIEYKKDTVSIGVSIFNKGDKTIRCYKVDAKDICTSLLKIKARDDVGNIYEVFPCESFIDLDSIYLNCNNTVILFENEGFTRVVNFSVKDFTPYIKEGDYELFLEVNYSISNFETELENVLKTDLVSKKYHFKYNK